MGMGSLAPGNKGARGRMSDRGVLFAPVARNPGADGGIPRAMMAQGAEKPQTSLAGRGKAGGQG